MDFLSDEELEVMGFKYVGRNVKISKNAIFYGVNRIEIGDNSRIDAFSIISAGTGGIKIGCYVHVACFCSVMGNGAITFEDFSGISSRVALYSSSDDYSGNYLTNPTVPEEYRNVISGPVKLGKHVVVGSGTVILPGVEIELGCAVGALSLVTKNCSEFGIYLGVPAKKIKERKMNIIEMEKNIKIYNKTS